MTDPQETTMPASLTLDQAPPIHYGDTISFTATFDPPPGKSVVEISVAAYVDGKPVYLEVLAASPEPTFTLSDSRWAGAPAECFAELFYYKWQGQREQSRVPLASTSFVTT